MKKWAIITASGGKTAQQRFDALHTYFYNKLSLPRGKTVRYASPEIHPTNGSIAIPVMPAAEAFIANTPFTVTLKTTEEIMALGWFADPPKIKPVQLGMKAAVLLPQAPSAGPKSFLQRHGFLIAASSAAALGAFAGYAHFFAHWF